MILPDYKIKQLGTTLIQPYREDSVQPASIDVHLDYHFYRAVHSIDADIHPEYNRSRLGFNQLYSVAPGNVLRMSPGDFVLASTFEKLTIPNGLVARFEGKSSLARLGLMTHVTAGFIDPGFNGHITLEMKNLHVNDWILVPGMKIGQISFEQMLGEAQYPYGHERNGSHYQGQRGPTQSKIHENFSRIDVYGDQ